MKKFIKQNLVGYFAFYGISLLIAFIGGIFLKTSLFCLIIVVTIIDFILLAIQYLSLKKQHKI